MRTQLSSDRTVTSDARLASFVTDEANRILKRFTDRLTRVEVHLRDLNAGRSGTPDKRCVVEARPARARPMSTTATARRLDTAIGMALRKMQRQLESFFDRRGRAVPVGTGAKRKTKTTTTTTASGARKRTAAAKTSPAAGKAKGRPAR
jgi:hypothetical protein